MEGQYTTVDTDTVIKVAGRSDPGAVGSIIARAVVAGQSPKIRAIGAGAVNQASKACAIARSYTAPRGMDLHYIIGFDDVPGEEEGKTISAITWTPVVR